MNPNGGRAIPALAPNDGRYTLGNSAYPVVFFAGVTDGRAVEARPTAMPIRIITAPELDYNGGTFHLVGLPTAMPLITGLGLQVGAGPMLVVYDVGGITPPPPTGSARITDALDTRTTSAGDTRIVE